MYSHLAVGNVKGHDTVMKEPPLFFTFKAYTGFQLMNFRQNDKIQELSNEIGSSKISIPQLSMNQSHLRTG